MRSQTCVNIHKEGDKQEQIRGILSQRARDGPKSASENEAAN